MGTSMGHILPLSAADMVRQGSADDIEAVEAALAELRLRESVVEVMAGLKIANQEGAHGVLVMFVEDGGLEMTLVSNDEEECEQPTLFDKIREKFGRKSRK